ncbi:hypothetical protein IW140_006437 [Coemansia sp. RSA 1813]|nr:hypothetical protein EV178_003105 [Coemansia sp. RSA 1646]KAJ1765444.1 hypothetical protein LPJ74_006344 [Coemansia sp. RSA 1843]KAJ2089449.1 hypothetical protein IW138_003479 [Coemansia sp. RSA 986]KAJ2214915.1 hypothetical protein EV179_002590 [Coemansia sp. RSA 487]KAJ2562380.1 hypothetical protein IW140_006437 [Coemansia sp. RSA 1813]
MYTSEPSPSSSKQPSVPASTAAIASGSGDGNGKNSRASVEFVRCLRKAFEDAYGHPSLVSATVRRCKNPDLVSVEYTTMQRDFTRDSRRKVAHSAVLSIQDGELSKVVVRAPTDATDVQSSLRSPTDPSLVAVLRSLAGSKRVVDIWRDDTLVKCIDVTDKHGEFYGDSTFGSLAWANDNSCIVYSAERPEYSKAKPDSASFISNEDASDGEITDDITGSVGGVADPRFYEAESDWGETFSGKRPPALIVLDIFSAEAKVLASLDGITPGQVQFLPDNSYSSTPRIVFTGYKHTVRKYGIVYCQNRPSGIYVADLGGEVCECIYSGAVRSPRVTPSGRGVVFLSTLLGGPHASTSEIVYYDLERRSSRVVVPIARHPLDGQQKLEGTLLPDGFVGIYANQLPLSPWLHVDSMPKRDILVFTSTWRSTSVIMSLDFDGQKLELQSPIDNMSSNSVLGASGDLLAGVISTPEEPGQLMVGEARFDKSLSKVHVQWHRKQSPSAPKLAWKIVKDTCSTQSESIFVYPVEPNHDTLYFWSKGGKETRPLVVFPHGGPHAATTLDYDPLVSGLARLGFGVLLVNFTGSLGFGQDAVFAQIGNMDTLTIDEIQRAASQIHSHKEGDAKATVYLGGSYSGYTGALLAGLVPGYYRGIVLRNPVINIGENAAMSDIPDWCWAELGLGYDFDSPPELAPNSFSQMWQASPSRMSGNVRDPLLLLLGAQDRRVPPAQSLSYYYRLKAANAPVQCKVYPGVGHPLDSVEAERDSFVSIARFYASSLKKQW